MKTKIHKMTVGFKEKPLPSVSRAQMQKNFKAWRKKHGIPDWKFNQPCNGGQDFYRDDFDLGMP